MPSEWLRYVADFSAIPDAQAAQALASGVMELYNRVAGQLHERQDEFTAYVASLQNLDASGEGLVEWCSGYFDGIELRAVEWEKFTRDKSTREVFMPLAMTRECEQDRAKRAWLSEAQFRANIAQALGVAAVVIRDNWRQRLFPPNEPCPCGSGAKYKRCCGSRLRLVRD